MNTPQPRCVIKPPITDIYSEAPHPTVRSATGHSVVDQLEDLFLHRAGHPRRQRTAQAQPTFPRNIANSMACALTASVNCSTSRRAASNSQFRSFAGRPRRATNAASAASFTDRRIPITVDTSTCHLRAASAWVISRDVTCKKISHFVSGDNTRPRRRVSFSLISNNSSQNTPRACHSWVFSQHHLRVELRRNTTVRVAKADLVPTDANLRGGYTSWGELVDACDAWMAEVNGREHRVTRRPPAEMLVEEQQRLHRLPEAPYTAVLGESRKVSWSSTVSFGAVTYSVPHTLADETVWVRIDGERVVVAHCAPSGPIEVARHQRSTPGHPMIDDAHYPPRPAGPLARRPKPTSAAEAEFGAIGDGARTWLVEAAAAHTSRMKVKMAEAVTLARLHSTERLDWALGHAAMFGRFADGDLASILAADPPGQRRRADDAHSLQPSTAAWGRLGGNR